MSERGQAKANVGRAAMRLMDGSSELGEAADYIRAHDFLHDDFPLEELFAMRDAIDAMRRRLEQIAYGDPL